MTASAAQLSEALERQGRFALGVPGLARPLESGIDGGAAFVAFEAAASGSVAEAHTAAWPVARVAALTTRIADALGALHDQGIAYGCLVPELIAEGEAGAVLFGFGVAGLATAFGAAGDASQLLPPEYRAPELRAALVPPTPASDVFALGVLLSVLLAPPKTSAEQGSEVPSLALALAPELDALLARATAPDPRSRPNDVRAFAIQLAHVASAPKIVAPTPAVAVLASEQAPAPDPVSLPAPVPVPALPLVQHPAALLPLPPRAASMPRSSLIALLVVSAGLLLMFGGVVGALIYAERHAPAKTASIVAPPTPPPAAAPAPKAAAPSASADDEPPLAPTDAEPEVVPNARRATQRHAPLVAPGIGPSSFPDEAHVALPVLGSEPIWGTRNATLTWVVFGDLDCPHTRRAWRALEIVKASFGDDLRIVFRHRPLREHPNALEAARVLAGLAQRRGSRAFFDVLHRVAQGEASLTPEHLAAELEAAGYGDLKLSELRAEGEHAVSVDLQLAGQFAVKSTPFSFLNGLPIDGERSALELEPLLFGEQRSATWLSAAGVPAAALYATRTSTNLIGVGDTAEARQCAPVGNSPAIGPADALVTLVEFADFECQFCKRVEPTLEALLARYPRTLRLVWKDYPLPQHKEALLLANFAAEAQRRGSRKGFWSVHDAIFAAPDTLDDALLGAIAGKAGLDGTLLLSAAHAGVHDAGIRADMALGQKLGVTGTPSFFANGRPVQGALDLPQFDALIREELKTAQHIVARGVAAKDLYGLVCGG